VTDEGMYRLIDGEARRNLIEADIGPDTLIPISVTNLSEQEAKKALLIADPLSAMAEHDSAALESLMRDVQIADEALAAMVAGMAEEAGIIPPEETTGGGEVPESNYVQQYGVTVICSDEAQQQAVFERLTSEGLECRVVVT